MCLAHLAALCHSIGQADPALGIPMNDLFHLTLDQLGNLSLEVRIEKYSNFDLLTGVRFFFPPPSEVRRLPELLCIIRYLGKLRWTRSTHVSGCVQAQIIDHCDIGK